ncbi:MAG: acyl--CoA ligase [Deltaproteobacteria bacterium]|nr:acyl--CoA ligase [Deltaproteobacteria bacterium]
MSGTVWKVFKETAQKNSHKTAVIYHGVEYSYGELLFLCQRLAIALHRVGIAKGERVIIYLPHCPQWVISWFSLQAAGACPVPITHFYGSRDIEYIAKDSGAKAVFCCETNYQNIEPLLATNVFKKVIYTNTFEELPKWKDLVNESLAKTRNLPYPKDVLIFEKIMTEDGEFTEPNTHPQDLAEILYTSGTTGLPKGVPFTNDVYIWSTTEERNIVAKVVPRGKAVILQGSPLYHILGQAQGLSGLLAGDTIVLLPRMDIEEVLASIERHRITNMFGTPTFYRMILEHPSIDKYDLSSLMWCYSGGDYLPPAFIERWKAKTGKYIYQGLGATEACGGITMTPGDEQIPEGSLGKVLSIWKAKLVDSDTMEESGIPGQGELLISSDHMINGYWNKPEDTARSFITLEGRLWYKTGDIVRIDDKGWVYFVDRSGDIIKHKGYRVVPSKVEKVLTEHPSISAACVVGIPDEEVGEKIKALVIQKTGQNLATEEELINWCKGKLAPYEVPHWVEYKDSLPTSPSGKILRRKVRTEEREKMAKS